MANYGGQDSSTTALVWEKIKSNWFLVSVVFAIWLAKLNPEIGATGGILKPEVTVKFIAVGVIFFLSGLSLKTEDLANAFLHYRLHFLVQTFAFIVVPCFMHVLVTILEMFLLNEWILKGLITVGCMPPPVSSAVILTKAVGGNEAAAIFNSAFGSFLGIIVTPITLTYFLGISTSIPISSTITQLSLTVMLPLVLGQITRMYVKDELATTRIPFHNVGSIMLLFIIYTTFCDTFSRSTVILDSTSLFVIVFIIACIQILFLTVLFYVTTLRGSGFTPADTVAILFSATHKSLTLGMPMLQILYAGLPALSTLAIPLLIYHPMQIVLGGLLVPHLRQWMLRAQARRRHYTPV